METRTPSPQQFTIDELCTLAGLPKRTVRYYVQIGLVDRPVGETKAARYDGHHLEQLLRIRKWSQAGLSLERIRELLADGGEAPPPRPRGSGSVEVWSHLVIADGLELMLEPGRAGLTPEQVRSLFTDVMRLYESLAKENNDDR